MTSQTVNGQVETYRYDNAGNLLQDAKNTYEYDAFRITSKVTTKAGDVQINRYDAEGLRCEVEGNEKAEQISNRYQYTGQQLDPIPQQYYLRARFYNPAIARFTQEDKYHGDGLNLYAYCANNPVEYYDPSGYDKLIIKPDRNELNGFSREDIEKLMANGMQRKCAALKANMASVVEKIYNKGWIKRDGSIWWPKEDGVINKKVVCLHPRLVLDRFGADRGKFVSPQGIPFENRALYPRTAKTPYSIFEVVKPIDVKAGGFAPWFNKPGGGIQFLLPKSVEQLLNDGSLKRVLIYK
ncbi:glycohydrolase toxin TNT-related protein [Selenomonas ruminantium]|uniref:glycohydrolase toxin TNT-related protein n=1 Tax=Selenomonas ruminantium TaxID=971 RepID=UPI00094C26D9